MATTGTTTFDLDFAEPTEEAFERCGLKMGTGNDLRTARRSLNLLLIEWANQGINLWTIAEGSQALTAGDGDYNLAADTVDLLDHFIRVGTGANQVDYDLERMSQRGYAIIVNKNQTGRPLKLWVDRQLTPRVVLWPIPDSFEPYTLIYWRMRRLYDVGSGGAYNQDVPWRFLPALAAGLSWKIAEKKAAARKQELEITYNQVLQQAQQEDRDRVSFRVAPGGYT